MGSKVRITDGEFKGDVGTVVEVHTGPHEPTKLAVVTDTTFVELAETDVEEVR